MFVWLVIGFTLHFTKNPPSLSLEQNLKEHSRESTAYSYPLIQDCVLWRQGNKPEHEANKELQVGIRQKAIISTKVQQILIATFSSQNLLPPSSY